MDSKGIMKDHELLALAPLADAGDGELFSKQKVFITDDGEIQWDLILHNGKDLHFRNKPIHLREGALSRYKDYIRSVISSQLDE